MLHHRSAAAGFPRMRSPVLGWSTPVIAAMIAVITVSVSSAPVAGVGPVVDGSRVEAASAPSVGQGGVGPCADRAHRFIGGRWTGVYRWSYRARSTPDRLGRVATVRALKRAVANITGEHNDCGRPDRVSASATYLGLTDRRPAPTERGGCAPRDGHNVVGFGRLPDGVAALACVWSIGDRIIEADIKLDRWSGWATSLGTCHGELMVEAVATHEFGHAFGLGHVSEAEHGALTMSRQLEGLCQNAEATLGLGDMLGLEELY